MSAFLTLDIETVPQARFADAQAWQDGAFDLDPDYLQGYALAQCERPLERGSKRSEVEEGKAVLAATKQPAALHATTCRIVQVSFGWRVGAELGRKVLQVDDYFGETVNELGDAEQPLVAEALDILASACDKRTTIVSFNGKSFDVPVLRGRAALLGLRVPSIPWRKLLYPFDDKQHADLRLILGADDRRARGTLQWWATAFGIHAEEHGADVFGWVQADDWESLRQYGCTEAQTLVELYERVQPIL